ncbi:MAG: hypothetical protein LBG52_03050 [Candidatus Peribacteria bacterium]|jgi:hypothetical protein|nr:hypothetical protein [Candidatus Peribacteria bacterium]
MKKNTFLIVVISLFLVNGGITLADNDYTPCESITDIPLLECEALVDFYYSTNGNEWTKGSSGRAGEEGKV